MRPNDILDARYLTRPTDWAALFGRRAPLLLEIGFGRGDHLVYLAQQRPAADLIGLEISQTALRKAASKVRNHRLTNVRIVDGAARLFLWANVPAQTLTELHINFPDPWYKPEHHHRRLITDDFLHLAATRLVPDGLLYIATDHPDYQPVVTDCLLRTPFFVSCLPTPYTTDGRDRFRTKYELKALAEGRTPFYYVYRRNATPTTAVFDPPEELPMPHAIVALPLTLDEIADRFAPFQTAVPEAGLHVRFLALYRKTADAALLVETYISQEPQHQHLGLTIADRGNGEVIVRLHEIGFPRATTGVHAAVGRLAAWLTTLHPEAAVLRHTLAAP